MSTFNVTFFSIMHILVGKKNSIMGCFLFNIKKHFRKNCPQLRVYSHKCDVAVIGGGIIGTAVARKLKLEHAGLETCLIEKECGLGEHQTSHNSGVMHCGVYYPPETLKARFCVEGLELLKNYCDEKKIAYRNCGKLIVAKECAEVDALNELMFRGQKNKVKNLEMLDSQCDILEKAAGCRGVKALWCPETANVDFHQITKHFGADFKEAEGKILLNTNICSITESSECDYPLHLSARNDQSIFAKYAVACGGLQSAALSNMFEDPHQQQFISLKVNYHQIDSKYCDNLQTNIYPVPDIKLPFLGAHFSPVHNNKVLLGPYAMPALKVEGYTNEEINFNYISKMVNSCGFRNMVIRNFKTCIWQAAKAICCEAQIKELQELMPNFSYQYVEKGPSAVQCQLLNRDGTFVSDFVFEGFGDKGLSQRIFNVKFTPSPAATSCLSIANYVVGQFSKQQCHV